MKLLLTDNNGRIRRTALLCALQLSLMGGTTYAQSAGEVVSGTVSDTFGPIMMANVVEIDKANRIVSSTQTDMNGNFSFKIKDPKNKIRFSYVGCKSQTVAINATTFNITLEDKTALSEVTVVSKRRGGGSGLAIPQDEMSTSNQSISTKEFEGLSLTTIDEALQGRIAGLDIVANSGNLGSGTSMRLRGVSSINASSEPLIVVDGNVWENDLGNNIDFSSANDEKFAELLNVNPEDIESISVLKDAAATAIWGSQGANGVIEIKTKRGARGKTQVTYSYRLTGTWQPKGYQMLTGDEYTMLMKEAYFNPKLSSDASNIIEFNYDTSNPNGWNNFNKNTDWVDAVEQTGWRQNHYISLQGGGEKANFRIGAGYDHETGSIIKQQLDRLSSRVALDYFVSDRIKIVTNLSFTYTKNDKNYSDLLSQAYRRMPNIPIYEYDSDNNNTGYYYNLPTTISTELQDQVEENGQKFYNPVALANLATNKETTYKISPEFKIEYNLLGVGEGKTQLKYEGKVIFDIFNKYNDTFLPSELNVKTWNDGSVNKSTADNYKSLGITTTHTLTFIPHFKNEDHSMMMMLRGQMTDGSSNRQATGVYGLPTGSIISTGAEGIIDAGTFLSQVGEWRSMYFTYSLHYAYKSRYMFDFSVRRDGSTKFGPDNRWGTFPALSLRWNINREPWMQRFSKWLSMLSVRPGWGIVGQQPSAEYLYFSKYSNGKGYLGETTTYPSNIRLSKLKWEQKKTWNLGFDFGFFNDKVTGNLELYKQYTSDLLMRNNKIPTSSGFNKMEYCNVGKMENSGWEFNINTNNLVKVGNLGIDFNVTFANNKNVLTEMEETCLKMLNAGADDRPNNGKYLSRVELDKPFGSIYGFRYKGTYQYSEYSDEEVAGVSGPNAPVVRDENGAVVKDNKGHTKPMMFCYGTTSEYEFKGGDAMYEDINHDGNINELDIVYLGSSLPKFTGGFGVKFKWGRWSWNNQFNFRYGNKIINGNRMNAESMYNNNNQSRAVNHRWRVEGDIASIPRALHKSGYNYLGSDRFVEDGSFLRLNYSQVSYAFPTKLIKKWGLSQLSFSISANNLFCITKYSGADPEVSYGSYGVVTDNAQTPRAKSVTGGITVQF